MALRIKCKCGKSLKISSSLAGKKLTCSDCGKPFRISTEKFKALAAAAAAKRKAAMPPKATGFTQSEPAELEIQPANLDAEILPAELDLLEGAAHSQSDLLDNLVGNTAQAETVAAPPAAVPVAVTPAAVGYAAERGMSRSHGLNVADDVTQGPTRGFWANAFAGFTYPFNSGGNVAAFLVISAIALLEIPLVFVGCYGVIGLFIVFGWLCALYLSVIQDTAGGSEDLPGIKMENGFLDDIVIPAFKYIGAIAVAFAPAVILSILLATNVLPASLGIMVPIWIGVGIFLIPVFLLLFSLNALNMLYRLDLIFLTIIRTFLPYMAMWLMLLLITFVYIVSLSAELLTSVGLQNFIPKMPNLGLAGDIVFIVLDVYLTIVAMRIIGLYYLHFKQRFAIVLE